MFKRFLFCICISSSLLSCASSVIQREHLRAALKEFILPVEKNKNWKVWITSMSDDCSGDEISYWYEAPVGQYALKTNIFVVEVFTDYLVRTKQWNIIERNRSNYWNDISDIVYFNNTTQKTETETSAEGKEEQKISFNVTEMCLLDETKKRSADKILSFRVFFRGSPGNKPTIHLRLSDVKTGIVELSESYGFAQFNKTPIRF